MYRIGKEEIDAVAKVINSGELFKINNGSHECMYFEEEFKEKIGSKHAILMTSGAAAIESGLAAMGIGPGDEVIIPAYTYIATAMAVLGTGAIPVVADVDETLTLDPDDFKRRISPATKAVIPVHIMGFPSNMARITEIAKENSILVLEDACQADGGSFGGRRLGTWGKAGAFSFNYFKIITAGEGGALVTDSDEVFHRALIYHDSSAIAYFGDQLNGVDEEQFCAREYRVSEITGAIMRKQLEKLDGILEDLRKNKKLLSSLISDKFALAPSHDIEGDCGTTIPLRFDSEEETLKVQNALASNGIDAVRPFDTGKHVYINWTPIVNKKGALNPKYDPFLFEKNKGLNTDYSPAACPKTLNLLRRTLYIIVNPDWNGEQIKELADRIKAV
ncbi:MAG: DegT/DnrJ/EryC1/StrS family aminotransferase [Clostridiales bacterium]|nr:DegT/DnrJ/EryC1/StrS family aminotransferase [Clostridiales bacterium]